MYNLYGKIDDLCLTVGLQEKKNSDLIQLDQKSQVLIQD